MKCFIQKIILTLFLFTASTQSIHADNEKYRATEAGLAAVNFILAATINKMDFNSPEDQIQIKTLYSAQTIIQTAIDALKIKNHNDYATGISWLVYDALSSLSCIANNGNNITEKPPFKLSGVLAAIEAATIIYAAYIQPEERAQATDQNISDSYNAQISSQINSLARLIGSISPNKFLIICNVLLIAFTLTDKIGKIALVNQLNIPRRTRLENLDEIISRRFLEEARASQGRRSALQRDWFRNLNTHLAEVRATEQADALHSRNVTANAMTHEH